MAAFNSSQTLTGTTRWNWMQAMRADFHRGWWVVEAPSRPDGQAARRKDPRMPRLRQRGQHVLAIPSRDRHEIVRARYVQDSFTSLTELPDAQRVRLQAAAERCRNAIAHRKSVEHQLSPLVSEQPYPELQAAWQQVTDAGEALGNLAGDSYARHQLGPKAQKVFEGNGSGTLDQVWKVPNPDTGDDYVVLECKGGKDPKLGTKNIDNNIVQQGHPTYLAAIIGEMERGNSHERKLAPLLRQAQFSRTIRYVHVRGIYKTPHGEQVNFREFDLNPRAKSDKGAYTKKPRAHSPPRKSPLREPLPRFLSKVSLALTLTIVDPPHAKGLPKTTWTPSLYEGTTPSVYDASQAKGIADYPGWDASSARGNAALSRTDTSRPSIHASLTVRGSTVTASPRPRRR